MRRVAALCLALGASACAGDTANGFGGPDTVWKLVEINGAPFDANATLRFPAQGRIAGGAPCNSYFGALGGTYPAFNVPVIGASKRACPDLPAESAYFAALNAVDRASRDGDRLILSDASGPRLVFTRAD